MLINLNVKPQFCGKVSFFLLLILSDPRAQPPNFINVGGLQIKTDPGAIPSDMLSFISTAPEGVLLFTMGFIFNPKVNHIFIKCIQ